MRLSSKIIGTAIAVLAVVCGSIWTAALEADHRGRLSVAFLRSGSSGAVLIEAPSGNTALIDGGPDANILRSLASKLPWWQRNVDVAVAAHPDASHAGGLIDVLERYRVAHVFVSSASGSGPIWSTFEKALTQAKEQGTDISTLARGQVIDLGGGALLEALFPDRDLSGAPSSDGCIDLKLIYGSTSFMLACGAPAIEEYLARLDGTALHADVLYASATTSPLFVGFVGAEFVGEGGVTFVSDGKTVVQE